MGYKRRSWQYSNPTKVQLHWSNKSSAYSLKFLDTSHWTEMQIFITLLNSYPYGDREYDPDNKIWYFMEKYLPEIQALFELLSPQKVFDVDFIEKPTGQAFVGTFVSNDTFFKTFNSLTGQDIKGLDYTEAKKVYRRVCLLFHPDRHKGDLEISKKMSSINEAWNMLEQNFYKTRKEMEAMEI
jgi:DnaJ domain